MADSQKTQTPLQNGLSQTPLVSLLPLQLPSTALSQPTFVPSLNNIYAEPASEVLALSIGHNILEQIQNEDMSFLAFPPDNVDNERSPSAEMLSSLAFKIFNRFDYAGLKVNRSTLPFKQEKPVNSTKLPPEVVSEVVPLVTSETVIQEDQNQKSCRIKEMIFGLINDLILSDDTDRTSPDDSKIWFALERPGKPSISDPVLINLGNLLKRAQSIEIENGEESDSVVRILRILGRALGEGSLVKLRAGVNETAIQYIDNSLKTCSVVLLVFKCFPKVHSEELLLNIIEFISATLDEVIFPFMSVDGKIKEEANKVLLKGLQRNVTIVLELLYAFLHSAEVGELVVTKLEFISSKIIFAESSSLIFGLVNVESMRVVAMKLLATIFGKYKNQQQFILNEVLLNIEKLPLTRLKARQFKLRQGLNIQLTTALLMLLVESSVELPANSGTRGAEDVIVPSLDNAASHCSYIVNYLVEKAAKSTRTGEDPHRLLMELFLEDFLNIHFLPEWPASELIVTCFISRFIGILESDNAHANALILSFESLGSIANCLLRYVQHPDKNLIVDMADMSLQQLNEWITCLDEVFSYLFNSGSDLDRIAANYLLCSYLSTLAPLKQIEKLHDLANKELGRDKLDRHGDGRGDMNAYFELLLSRPIARYYDKILALIVGALDHSKVNVRSKALKLVSSLLDKNEDIFSMNLVQRSLSNRLVDNSPLVRDAAVEIIGKYLIKKPQKQKDLYMILCDRSNDTGTAVRKRVVKLFREIYHTAPEEEAQIHIVDRLVRRIEDEELAVSDLAASSLKDIIFKEYKSRGSLEAQKLYRDQVLYMTAVLYEVYIRSETLGNLLANFFSKLLNPLSKSFDKDKLAVAADIVRVLSDELSEELSTKESEKILCILSVLATANGSLIDPSLLKFLEAFLVDNNRPLSSLLGYYTLVVLRCHLETTLLVSRERLQSLLLTRLTKFNLRELPEAVQCLWALSNGVASKKIAVALISCLKLILPYEEQAKSTGIQEPDQKLVRLVHLVGQVSRYCTLDDHWEMFQKFDSQAHDVADLVIRKLSVFCSPLQCSSVRKLGLKNIGNVCIGHPKQFLNENVLQLMTDAINSGSEGEVVMKVILDHLNDEESTANRIALLEEKKDSIDVGVLHGITTRQESDGASSAVVQSVLGPVLRISLLGEDNLSLLATYLLERILKQGYANPRVVSISIERRGDIPNKCITTVVSLETSSRQEISKIARDIHAKLYAKHGALLENSYVEALKQATRYRRRVSGNFARETTQLDALYNIIKGSKHSRRKLLAQLMKSIDFDFATISLLDVGAHLDYVIFLSSGLGNLQFVSTEEVHLVVYGADRLLSGTGLTLVNHLENTEVNELLGTAAYILCVAWGLREFLKSAYNLSDSKCREFTPNLPAKETKAMQKSGNFMIESLGLDYGRNDLEISRRRCERLMTIMNNEPLVLEREDGGGELGRDIKRLRVE